MDNKYNIPEMFEVAVEENKHKKDGDYSVTQIIQSPTKLVLGKRYLENLNYDLSERTNALIGIAVHKELEKTSKYLPHIESEIPLLIETDDGVTISGTADFYNAKKKQLGDYKVWKMKKVLKGEFKDVTEQLNIYAYGLSQIGYDIKELVLIPIIKDYAHYLASIKPDSPLYDIILNPVKDEEDNIVLSPVPEIRIPLWSKEEQKKFIEDKIGKIIAVEGIDDNDLEGCEDKWETERQYKVYQKGTARAKKVCKSNEEAEKWLEDNKKDGKEYYIDIVGGEPLRCLQYCDVNKYCPFYKKYIEETKKATTDLKSEEAYKKGR